MTGEVTWGESTESLAPWLKPDFVLSHVMWPLVSARWVVDS